MPTSDETRCVQDFMALGSENCNTASVCLSSGPWITSSRRKIYFAAICVLNLIQLKPHRAPMLLYDTILRLSMRLSVRFGVMRPKYRQPNELKFSPRFFLTPLMRGRARVWFILCSPQWIAYLSTGFVPAVSSGTQCSRNTTNIAHASHTTIHAKVKEFWEVSKEETVVGLKKL